MADGSDTGAAEGAVAVRDEAAEGSAPRPAPTRRARHDGWTGERRRGFVEALAKVGNVRDACRTIGLSNTSAYRLRRIDRGFRTASDQALDRAAVSLEAIAYTRAVDGVDEVTFRDGKEVSRKRRYSDSLLRFIVQAAYPEKYGAPARPPR